MKTLQYRITKEEMSKIVDRSIEKLIKEQCMKQGVDKQIAFEISQAVVDIGLPDIEDKVIELSKRLAKIEQAVLELKK
jgi:predicted component of type VI protein secretion system